MWNPFKKRSSQPSQSQESATPDYQTRFWELVEGVKGGATGDEVEAWMQSHGVDESGLVQWLAGYVGEVKRARSPNERVLEALQGLSEVARDELGRKFRDLAVSLQGSETDGDFGVSEVRKERDSSNLSEVQKFNELMSQLGTSQSISTSFSTLDRGNLEARSLSYQEWFNRGVALGDLGRLEEAITSYDQALHFKPDLHQAWFNRGIALFNLGKYEEAITSYDQALHFKPDYHEALGNRGNALFNLGRLEEAIASYDQALHFKPNDHRSWGNQGIALFNLGKYEEAIASYDQALHFKPDYHEALGNRGNALGKLGRLEEAIASYDQALHFKPNDHRSWGNQGFVLEKLGKYEEAIAFYDQALHFKPDDYQAWYSQGFLLEKLGKYEEAITSYDQALHFKPDDHRSWCNRGIAAASSSQYDPQFQRNFLFYFQGSLKQSHQQIFSEGTFPQQSIQSLLTPKVTRYIQQTAQKHFCVAHPELNQRGYQGLLNSLQFPLNQNIICQDTHPEGWGFLHHGIGKAHYNQGRQVENIRPYWKKAENSYKTALETLTVTDYHELHLEVLQDLSTVLLALKETEEARVLLQDGTDLLNRMLKEFKGGDYAKQQLARKFTAFNQLTVSLALQSGNSRDALTQAETGKNTCLRWIWNYGEIPDRTYDQIRELLITPETALIYWHLSPISLSTFLLLPNIPDPILISPPPSTQPKDKREPALLQIIAFEEWVKKWNQDYNTNTKKDEKKPSSSDRPWYAEMETQLTQLQTLLNISEIEQHLNTHNIQHLILIPHRDLHRFPLPTFFENQTCITLPSAYLGTRNTSSGVKLDNLLMVEHPQSTLNIGNKTQSFQTLYDAQIECELIQSQFSHPQRLNPENTRKNRIIEALQQPHDIFHFCGHSAYNPQNPALSSLYLNGEDTLTLKDVLNLDLQEYRLVVLSSCETAITGNQTITDEYVGLVSGFLRAGATHVLSTLWAVESLPTTLLIVKFYQNLHQGQTPATALKNAQSWLKNATQTDLQQWLDEAIAALSHNPPVQLVLENIDFEGKIAKMERDRLYSHPYYWSSFILSGK